MSKRILSAMVVLGLVVTVLIGVSNQTSAAMTTSGTNSIGYDKSGYDKKTGTWGTGNQSGYGENDWVQYQYTISGVNGTVPSFNVVYDEQVSNRIFIDALSNFRVIVDAPYVTAKSVLANNTPEPPSTDIGNWHAFTPTGTINAAYVNGNCTNPDPLNAPSALHCFRIDPNAIHAANTNFPVTLSGGNHTITIYFEAHIAATFVWSSGHESQLSDNLSIYGAHIPANAVPQIVYGTSVYSNWTAPFTGAGGGGSNRHFNIQDQSAGNSGNLTLPIPAVTSPTSNIIISKVTNPNPATGVSFPFSSDFGSFTLDTDPTATYPNSVTYSGLPAGVYHFTEGTEPDGWGFSGVTCSPTQQLNGTTETVTVTSQGTTIVCTYTNFLKASPTISTNLSATSVSIGAHVHDSSSLAGASSNAVGTVTYHVYAGANTCTGPDLLNSTVSVTNGAVSDSSDFIPGAAGTYSFQAVYSGDANNNPATSTCSTEQLVVNKNQPTIATTLSSIVPVAIGASLHDSSTLSSATANAGGTVTYHAYAGAITCSGSDLLNSQVTVTNRAVPDSGNFVPSAAGTYSFQAVYSGDANNNSATSTCSTEQLSVSKNQPSIATTLSSLVPVAIGTAVHDSSALTGATSTAGGSVTYTAYTNSICTLGAQTGGIKTVTNAVVPDADPITFNNAGDYYWQAVYTGDSNNMGATTTCTSEHLVVSKSSPSISTTPNPSSGALGVTLNDAATLSGGSSPTGDVTFKLFDPSNATCIGAPTYSETIHLSPYATATGFVSNAAGTWHWTADYAGDANNNPAASGCSAEAVIISKVTPTIATTLSSLVSVTIGSSVHDSSTLSGVTANAGGTVNYHAYAGANTCSGSDLLNSQVTVTNGSVPDSGNFTPNSAGTYSFQAVYSGDANNNSATSTCSTEQLSVSKNQPSIATTLSSSTIPAGSSVHDSASLTNATTNATGTVTYTMYTDNLCTLGAVSAGTKSVNNSAVTDSDSIVLNSVGDYYWQAVYSGDANNNGATSTCTSEHLIVTKGSPTIATTPSAGGAIGVQIHDTATLSGGGLPTGGTVNFFLYGPTNQTCASPELFSSLNRPVSGGSATSTNFFTSGGGVGTYHWKATYNGDANNNPVTSVCADEPVTITKGITTLTTNASGPVIVGSTINDVAHLAGGIPSVTGTITFNVYLPGDTNCSSPVAVAGATVLGAGNYTSANYTTTAAGTYRWIAHYSGNSNNNGADTACNDANEISVVNKANLGITTAVHSDSPDQALVGHLPLGGGAHDLATVTGKVGAITLPSVTFYFFPKGVACTNGDTTGSTQLNTLAPNASNVAHPSTSETALAAGTYNFMAVVATDTNYNGATSNCESFTVDKAQLTINTAIYDASHNQVTSAALGSVVHDTATIGGTVNGFIPSSAVSFTFDKMPSVCGTTGIVTAANLDSGRPRSNDTSALSAGDYNFQAMIADDDNYIGVTSACEPLTINKADLTLTTQIHDSSHADVGGLIHVPLNSIVHNTATLTGQVGSFVPTGSLTFNLFSTIDCTGQSSTPATSLELTFYGRSDDSPALSAGSYSYSASVGADGNYNAAGPAVCESLTVDEE